MMNVLRLVYKFWSHTIETKCQNDIVHYTKDFKTSVSTQRRAELLLCIERPYRIDCLEDRVPCLCNAGGIPGRLLPKLHSMGA